MGMSMIRLRPGVNAELTASLNEAGYSVSNLGRFRNGLFEKIGGWARYYANAVGGVPKALHAWLDLNEVKYLAVGTTTLLGAITDGDLVDITPQDLITDFEVDGSTTGFTTSSGDPEVIVNDPNVSNVTDFDSVEFLTPVSVGGIILSGVYPVDVGLGGTTYQIVAADNAASTVTFSGMVPVFDTTANSATVTVSFPAHGLSVGDKINFPIPTYLSVAGNDTYSKILLAMNGVDASTTFTDTNAGGSAHTWTAAGNAQIDTAEYKFGGASGLFDGTGDWISTPDSSDFALGSGDWTVDFWFNCNAATGTSKFLFGQCDSSLTATTASAVGGRDSGTDAIFASAYVGSTGFTVFGTTPFNNATNTGWHHFAFVRTGNTLKLFIDGVQEGGDVAIAGTVNNSTNDFRVGALGEVTSSPWLGWIDEFRLSVGVARWTTNFTPPKGQYATSDVVIEGTYTATTTPTSSTFTIGISALAELTTTVPMNEGRVELLYHIALGPAATGTGYSVGTYSSGSYSTGTAVSAQTGTPIAATDWSLDNWGEILIATPDGGGIYYWQPNTGFQNARMIATPNAPAYNTGCFVSMQTQMLICYGSTDELAIGLDQDPLLVKWTNNTGDFTDFVISTTSQAGSRRLSTGSRIVGGMSVAQQELLWTDLGLWSMTYLGSLQAGVWGFNQIGWSCGLIGKHANARLGSNVYWMSAKNFFVLDGSGVKVIPCAVWDTVFQDLNTAYQHKCVAWANTPFNEVFFLFPRASTNAVEPDFYVKLNTLEGVWDYGPLPRSAGIDQSIVGMPISATPDGIVYEHEVSPNADGQPINAYFMTGDAQMSEGQDVIFSDWLLPDAKWALFAQNPSATLLVTFYTKYYPGETPVVHGPYSVTSTTKFINPRLRGRLLAMRVESNDLGSWWRMGGMRYRGAPDGRLP